MEQIKAGENAQTVFDGVYTDLVLLCVALIEKGENEACRAKYTAYVEMLIETYPV